LRTFLLVESNSVSGREDEYNDWYSNQHLADLLTIPGFEAAQRFVLSPEKRFPDSPDHPYRYLALYEFDGSPSLLFERLGAATQGPTPIFISPAMDQQRSVTAYTPITERRTRYTAMRTQLVGEGLFEEGVAPDGAAALIGSKCTNCEEVLFPAMIDCPACLGFETMRAHKVEGRGRLVSCVVSERGPAGFIVPYVQAYVRLVDGPVIFTTIGGINPSDGGSLRAGDELIMSIEPIRRLGDTEIVGWKFRPAAS
jgi:uncharacterized OB-fold protein